MEFSSGFELTIAGQKSEPADWMDVVNPATGQAFAKCPVADAPQLDAAVAAAEAALPAWRALGIEARREKLLALADAIEANADGLGSLFTQEQGRPLPFARHEITASADWLRAVARQNLEAEVVEDSDARRVEVRYGPLGVVAAIVPWNFPFLLAIWKIGPALLTGNTMVLKPSPFTPLCALKLGELARDILPAGVFNVIAGQDALGPLMTAHPGFAKISFTGSTATGKRVMESAARDLKRITLELGGNDAGIVMPDIDIDAVAPQLFAGAFFNSSQICVATKRLYIHETIYDEVRDKLHALAREAAVGDGTQQGIMYGPIQNEPQYRRVRGLLDDARAQGLTLLEGSEVPNQGYFVPFTLVDNPPEDSRVVQEEAFGPILPLLKFSNVDDVIERANDSEYGLAGSVWSGDIEGAVSIADRLDTGTVWINQILQNAPHIPFAGAKNSGVGTEHGREGLLEFTQPKTIFIPKG